MSWDKRCDNCIHSVTDWTNPMNGDNYCRNEESEEYGFNTEYIFGCEEWEGEDETD